MIINIRGTNGSGKSWLLHKLMHHMGGTTPVAWLKQEARKKYPVVHRCKKVVKGKKVYIIGIYTSDIGGGCDVIRIQPKIYELAGKFSKKGHVVLEGLLMSGMCGSLTRLSQEIDAQVVWAVLDTPFEKCYKATLLRRHTKGNFGFLDIHKNMLRKHLSIVSSVKHAIKDGERVVMLDHNYAFDKIMEWLRDGKAKKPNTWKLMEKLDVLRKSVPVKDK